MFSAPREPPRKNFSFFRAGAIEMRRRGNRSFRRVRGAENFVGGGRQRVFYNISKKQWGTTP